MVEAPDNLVLQLLREIRAAQGATDDKMAGVARELRAEMKDLRAEFKSDMQSLRADVASDLLMMRKEIGEQIVGVRRAMIEYHSTVIGHGIPYQRTRGSRPATRAKCRTGAN